MSFFKINVTANVVKPVGSYDTNETNKTITKLPNSEPPKVYTPKRALKSPLNSTPEESKATNGNSDEWAEF